MSFNRLTNDAGAACLWNVYSDEWWNIVFSGRTDGRTVVNLPNKPKSPLTEIPGVGGSIAADLEEVGFRTVKELVGVDPERLYRVLCVRQQTVIDRCMLYVCRCAVYYAETPKSKRDPSKLLWQNWKDSPAVVRAVRKAKKEAEAAAEDGEIAVADAKSNSKKPKPKSKSTTAAAAAAGAIKADETAAPASAKRKRSATPRPKSKGKAKAAAAETAAAPAADAAAATKAGRKPAKRVKS